MSWIQAKMGPCWNWKSLRPCATSTMMLVLMLSAGIESSAGLPEHAQGAGGGR